MSEMTFHLAGSGSTATAPPRDAFLSLPQAATPDQAPRPEVVQKQNAEEARRTARDMNAAMQALNEQYRFGIYQDTDQFYVQVLDANSGKVLKTRPVQDLLDLHKRLQDMVGLVMDEHL